MSVTAIAILGIVDKAYFTHCIFRDYILYLESSHSGFTWTCSLYASSLQRQGSALLPAGTRLTRYFTSTCPSRDWHAATLPLVAAHWRRLHFNLHEEVELEHISVGPNLRLQLSQSPN